MKQWFIFLFLLVVTNPYQGRGIEWGEDEPQLYEYKIDKRIIVVTPEPDKSETKFNQKETDRFIRKVNKIINGIDYSPYVFYLNSQVIDTPE